MNKIIQIVFSICLLHVSSYATLLSLPVYFDSKSYYEVIDINDSMRYHEIHVPLFFRYYNDDYYKTFIFFEEAIMVNSISEFVHFPAENDESNFNLMYLKNLDSLYTTLLPKPPSDSRIVLKVSKYDTLFLDNDYITDQMLTDRNFIIDNVDFEPENVTPFIIDSSNRSKFSVYTNDTVTILRIEHPSSSSLLLSSMPSFSLARFILKRKANDIMCNVNLVQECYNDSKNQYQINDYLNLNCQMNKSKNLDFISFPEGVIRFRSEDFSKKTEQYSVCKEIEDISPPRNLNKVYNYIVPYYDKTFNAKGQNIDENSSNILFNKFDSKIQLKK